MQILKPIFDVRHHLSGITALNKIASHDEMYLCISIKEHSLIEQQRPLLIIFIQMIEKVLMNFLRLKRKLFLVKIPI